MAEKVTIMVLKVDLECTKCYKKVKKLLCKYPQIRDQVYNEKANTVTITVVCCSPEKIRDKLCCKGRGTIKSIDIKEPEKKKEPEKPKAEPEKPKPGPEKPKQVEKPPADKPKDKPKEVVTVVVPPPADKPKDKPKEVVTVVLPPADKPKDKPKEVVTVAAPPPKPAEPKPPVQPEPVPVGYPYPASGAACCGPCYDGRPGGPCFSGYGMPMLPPQCNCGCGGGRSVCCYNNGYGGSYTVTRCDYFSEENQAGCTVM